MEVLFMSIYKRGKTWTVQMVWYVLDPSTKTGKKKQYKTKGGFKTKAEAKQWEAEQTIAKKEKKISNQNPVFSDYFWEWSKIYRIPLLEKNTIRKYEYTKRVLEQYFGQTKINSITRTSFQKFLNDYGANRSKATVLKTYRLVKASVLDAYDEGLLSENFIRKTQPVWNETKTLKIEYLSIAEIQQLNKQLKDTLHPSFTSKYIIITAIYTGMRIGEIMALKWSDLDRVNHTIRIQKSWDYIHNELKKTKNESSVRTIKIPESLIEILDQLKKNKQEFIFAHKNGKLPSNNAVNKCLKENMQKIGIIKKNFHFHSLRHCHVAYLHAMHVDWYEISKRLGHSSVAFTMEQYAYLIDEMSAQQDKYVVSVLDHLDKPDKELNLVRQDVRQNQK